MVLSVGTKLLISIVALLTLVIGFLSLSTVFLLREDKRAYVYQSQSTAAVLAGREFVNTVRHGLDTARVALGSFDPLKTPTAQELAALKSIVQNQTGLLRVDVMMLDPASATARPLAEAARESAASPDQPAAMLPAVSADWWKILIPDLLKSGYAFVNLTNTDGPPIVGVIAADLKYKDNPAGIPVALGTLTLRGLSQELRGLSLTIATATGFVLYDTNAARLHGKANVADDPLFDLARKSTTGSGAAEYDHQGVRLLGSYVKPGMDVVLLSSTEWNRAIRSTYSLLEKFILLGAMAIGAAIVFAIFFSRTLTAPINRLYQATFEIARGNFDLDLKAASRDEIGVLTDSFSEMSRQITGHIAAREQQVHLEQELAIASTVQQTLIPPEVYNDDKLLIHSHYRAASQCGGDWWGFFRVGNKVCVMIADATGHGFPSALITASARSCFSVMHKLAQEHGQLSISPVTMLHYANRVIFEASASKIMMTMFVAVIDFDTSTLAYASAGHNPPWLFRHENGAYKLTSLVAVGHRLGEKQDAHEFEQKSVPFGPNDILLLYTDGLMEGRNPGGEMYGKKRVRTVVEQSIKSGPQAVIANLMSEFLAYNGDKPLDDDVTLAAAMFHPAGGGVPPHATA
ncbi:MAG TPA: SpoIIE family protein phosphatase [Bdellovibrionota bacterium]|nr:SpoIIE family protein phosphatase [Bdellovibrionota bacterium]